MDIRAIAAAGVNKAWGLIASELKACTLRCLPSSAYTAATDTTVTTWGKSVALSAFIYGEKDEEKEATTADEINTQERKQVALALIRVSDCDNADPNDQSELVEGATVWKVQAVQRPPGGAIFILDLQR